MDLRQRAAAFMTSCTITHHGTAGAIAPARTKARTMVALVAALGLGACASDGARGVDAPTRAFDLPDLAAAAAANGGHAVSFVDPDRASHYLSDVDANRVAPDGGAAEGGVNDYHKNQLALLRLGDSPPSAIYSSDAEYGASCTGVPARDADASYITRSDDAGFEDPGASARFTTLHELGGHCAYLPDATVAAKGKNYVRHVMESQADAVGAALLAAEHGHTRDARKIADLRAVSVASGAHTRAKDAAGREVAHSGVNSAAYMTLNAMDATIDWAERRLARPSDDPGHLSNMPAREIIGAASAIAHEHTLAPAQLVRLNRHVTSHIDPGKPFDPKTDFRSVPTPRDPAIRAEFIRMDAAHGRLYGQQARSQETHPRPRLSARAGRELVD